MADKKPSLTDYWNMLNGHDWYYDYSDDPRVYRSGVANHNALKRLAELGPEYKELYQGFEDCHSTSPHVPKTPKPPKPE